MIPYLLVIPTEWPERYEMEAHLFNFINPGLTLFTDGLSDGWQRKVGPRGIELVKRLCQIEGVTFIINEHTMDLSLMKRYSWSEVLPKVIVAIMNTQKVEIRYLPWYTRFELWVERFFFNY